MSLDLTLLRDLLQLPYPPLFVTLSGAHLYGFPSPDSDFDLRGAHVLPLNQVIGLTMGPDTLDVSEIRAGREIDLVTHDVGKYFGLLLKRNGYVLEQIFSPLSVLTTPEHRELKTIAKGCITKHHAHHYLGFARTQWKLFSKETQPRLKPLLYVYRVLMTGIHLMRTGRVEADIGRLNDHFQLSYIRDLVARKNRRHRKIRAANGRPRFSSGGIRKIGRASGKGKGQKLSSGRCRPERRTQRSAHQDQKKMERVVLIEADLSGRCRLKQHQILAGEPAGC